MSQFQIPSSWRQPNVALSFDEQVKLANNALTAIVNDIDTKTGLPSGTNIAGTTTIPLFYDHLVLFDQTAKQTTFHDVVLNGLQNIDANDLHDFAASFPALIAEYGIACARAYVTYGDSVFLSMAESAHQNAIQWLITDASTFPPKLKNFALPTTCNGASVIGGNFWSDAPPDPQIGNEATANILLLSTLLAQATPNNTYVHIANLNSEFIRSQLYNANDGTIANLLSLTTCQISNPGPFTYDVGVFVEGMSNLAVINRDSSITSLVQDIAQKATLNSGWNNAEGVITASGIDSQLVRGLSQVAINPSTDPHFRDYLQAYISVQFNAVTSLATVPGSNVYSASFVGPPSSSFNFDSQTQASVVLVNMLPLQFDTTSVSSPSAGNNLPPSASGSSGGLPGSSGGLPGSSGGLPGSLAPSAGNSAPSAINSAKSPGSSGSAGNGNSAGGPPSSSGGFSNSAALSTKSNREGVIAGIVVGVCIAIVACMFILYWCRRRKRRNVSGDDSNADPPTTRQVSSGLRLTPFFLPTTASGAGQVRTKFTGRYDSVASQPFSFEPPSSGLTSPELLGRFGAAAQSYPADQKRRLVADGPLSPSNPNHSVTSTPNSPSQNLLGEAGEEPYIPTEILVRQLNDRLRQQRPNWDGSEVPPLYGEQ